MMIKVAIVEDDLAIAQMYRLKFESEGFRVQICGNGRLGLSLIEEMEPDIVLSDLMMPEMNGDEMIEVMRKTDWGKDIKVLVLTNVSEQEAPDSLKDLAISGFIVKADTTPADVVKQVKKILGL